MDNLITLIFIIIAVLSVLGKIQPKKKPAVKSPKTGGWMTRLNDYLTDLQNKIEQQAKTNPSDASGWDELMDDGAEDKVEYDADEYSLEDLVLEEDQPHPEVMKDVQEVPAPSQLPPGSGSLPLLHAEKATVSVSILAAKSRQDLREAVIWSEILGPPVALRDQTGNRR